MSDSYIKKSPAILVGILDWGLGHACRMVPLIRYLLQSQCQILVAATGPQRSILEMTFPDITFLSPPEYGIRYTGKNNSLVSGLAMQVPRLLGIIRKERAWVSDIHRKYGLDLIISDNRYGFHIPGVHSVILTHQIAPVSGLGPWIDHVVSRIHVSFLLKFNECWIPDSEDQGLSGKLSHVKELPSNARFIGPLSRLEKTVEPPVRNGRLLIMISGPEPSRTRFEALLLRQLKDHEGPYTLVRGLPGGSGSLPHALNHVTTEQLAELIRNSEFIICRAGYTTIMDLVRMGRTALLVPTPGQTEQEYLAEYLSGTGSFISCTENDLDLTRGIERLRNFTPVTTDPDFEQFKPALKCLLDQVKAKD